MLILYTNVNLNVYFWIYILGIFNVKFLLVFSDASTHKKLTAFSINKNEYILFINSIQIITHNIPLPKYNT